MYIKEPPTTLPAALERIKELEQRLEDLKLSIDYGIVPAWVITDLQEENGRLADELAACTQERLDMQS